MNRSFVAALFVLCLATNLAPALEIKNIRPSYGPLGATRYNAKYLPADLVFMTYDIDGLAAEDKSGKVSYQTVLELLDANEKVLFKKPTTNEAIPRLGGTRMPGDLHLLLGRKQAAGKYSIRLTVIDKVDKNANSNAKAFKYDFEVLPEGFGFIGLTAPAVQFPGLFYKIEFALVNLALDKKKEPDAEVTIRILNEAGTLVSPAIEMKFPRDMAVGTDLEQVNFIPLEQPIFMNRVGRYTVELTATDKAGKKETKVSLPVNVLDVGNLPK